MKHSKWILGLIFGFVMATTAFASVPRYYSVNGQGWSTGGCNTGPAYRSCVNNIEWRAENDSVRDAERQCFGMRGRLQSTFPTSCWNRCNPMNPPPGNNYISVSCRADCNFTCIVP